MLTFTYPIIPPSLNSVYKISKGGKMYMNTQAKVYKDAFIIWSREKIFKEISGLKISPYDIFSLNVDIYFPYADLMNDKYGKDGRVKSPYKRLDIDNRIKLLQDCIAAVMGADDKQIFDVRFRKFCAKTPKEKRVEIDLQRTNLKNFVEESL